MPAEYPAALASFVSLEPGEDGTRMDEAGKSGTEVVTKIHVELAAVQAELGTDPAGASPSVKARLDALDTTVAGKESSGAAAAAVAAHEAALDPHTQYATDSALSSGLAGKADTSHAHVIADTTGLQTALDGKAASSHTHVAADVTDLGDAATLDVGTTAGTVAAGDHGHSGVYSPVGHGHTAGDVSGLSTVATTGAYGDLSGKPTLGTAAAAATADFDAAGAAAAAQAAAIAASQPLDSDLSAIAALTTTAWGRALLELADAAAGRSALGLGSAAVLSTADVDERARDALGSALVAGSGISITPNDGGDTITVAATGGGGSSLDVRDEGSSLTTAATVLDFVGPGVAATEPTADQIRVTVNGFWEQPTASDHVVFPPHTLGSDYSTKTEVRAYRIWLKAGVVYKGFRRRARTADASATFRAAVYEEDSGTGSPSNLITATAVSAALTGTSSTHLFASTWTVPSDGFYYVAAAIDGGSGSPALRAIDVVPAVGTAPSVGIPVRGSAVFYDLSYSGGSFSDPMSPSTPSTAPSLVPAVFLVSN